MAVDATRTLRGALAGVAAAGVWAAQQPLDQRVFGVVYDDVRLLGRLASARGPAEYPVGLALHLVNGAAFGAAYAHLRPAIPGPAWLRGPLAGLAEHLATWPATMFSARLPGDHPIPTLWGSWPAFGQATWRHLLFGTVLGEVERRLNPPEAEAAPMDDATASTNGHGRAEDMAVSGQQ
jgi:hypothetical protein